MRSEPLTAPQNCSRIPGKSLQLLGTQKLPVSPQNLEKAALIYSQNKGRLMSQLLPLYSVELKGLFSLKAERFN